MGERKENKTKIPEVTQNNGQKVWRAGQERQENQRVRMLENPLSCVQLFIQQIGVDNLRTPPIHGSCCGSDSEQVYTWPLPPWKQEGEKTGFI